MEDVKLKFETMHQLWQFKEKMQLRNFEIQTGDLLLFCQLPEEAIALAVSQHGEQRVERDLNHNKPLTIKQGTYERNQQ